MVLVRLEVVAAPLGPLGGQSWNGHRQGLWRWETRTRETTDMDEGGSGT